MNIAVDYNDELERINAHPGLLPQEVDTMSSDTVDLMKKSVAIKVSKKPRKKSSRDMSVTSK